MTSAIGLPPGKPTPKPPFGQLAWIVEKFKEWSVRYIVDDVDAAVEFYTKLLGFHLALRPAPGFASLTRGNLRLLLNAPGAAEWT